MNTTLKQGEVHFVNLHFILDRYATLKIEDMTVEGLVCEDLYL